MFLYLLKFLISFNLIRLKERVLQVLYLLF
jgi:hypothetical protein